MVCGKISGTPKSTFLSSANQFREPMVSYVKTPTSWGIYAPYERRDSDLACFRAYARRPICSSASHVHISAEGCATIRQFRDSYPASYHSRRYVSEGPVGLTITMISTGGSSMATSGIDP